MHEDPTRDADARGRPAAGDGAAPRRVPAAPRFDGPDTLADHAARLSDVRPGDRLGTFVLGRELGRGGFGTVWSAREDGPLAREVALKLVLLGMDTRAVLDRFEAERLALGRLEHPNVARAIAAGATETGRPWFAMELVEGLPLTEYCRRHRLDLRERLELFLQVCDGVRHAHQRALIHRDLKPGNVLVRTTPDGPQAKIIDFGIAKALAGGVPGGNGHGDGDAAPRTRHDQLLGTLEYMSPEQADPQAYDVDARSDVYALGVILYEVLVGHRPFDDAPSREQLRDRIVHGTPTRPSTRVLSTDRIERSRLAEERRIAPDVLARRLRGDLDWIVLRAMERDRARRYQDVGELADDLGRHLRDEPVRASPPSRLYRLRKAWRRNRPAVAAAALLAAALVVGTALSLQGAAVARTAAAGERAARNASDRRADRLAYALAELRLANGDARNARRALHEVADDRRGWTWGTLARRIDGAAGSRADHVSFGVALERTGDGALLGVDESGTVRRWIVGGPPGARTLVPGDAPVDTGARGGLAAVGPLLDDGSRRVLLVRTAPDAPRMLATIATLPANGVAAPPADGRKDVALPATCVAAVSFGTEFLVRTTLPDELWRIVPGDDPDAPATAVRVPLPAPPVALGPVRGLDPTRGDAPAAVIALADGRVLLHGAPPVTRATTIVAAGTGRSPVTAVAARRLPDGSRRLAIARADGTVELRAAGAPDGADETAAPLAVHTVHRRGAHVVAVAPDGRSVLSADGDGLVGRLSLDGPLDRPETDRFRGHRSGVVAVAFAGPDGSPLAASIDADGTLIWWPDDDEVLVASDAPVIGLALAGSRVVAALGDEVVAVPRGPGDGPPASLALEPGALGTLVAASDGRAIAIGRTDGRLERRDAATLARLGSIALPEADTAWPIGMLGSEVVIAQAFTGARTRLLRWDTETGLRPLALPSDDRDDRQTAAAVHEPSGLVAVGTWGGRVHVRTARAPEDTVVPVRTIELGQPVSALAFTTDGRLVIGGSDGAVALTGVVADGGDPAPRIEIERRVAAGESTIAAVAMVGTRERERILAATVRPLLLVLEPDPDDAASLAIEAELTGHDQGVFAIATDGAVAWTGGLDGRVRRWAPAGD